MAVDPVFLLARYMTFEKLSYLGVSYGNKLSQRVGQPADTEILLCAEMDTKCRLSDLQFPFRKYSSVIMLFGEEDNCLNM
ncbi:hypothetical protein JTE90_027427 [Oedothorax gibbosus]|uniref:Uncharacterized protein n=1 Tax=Oedothorax gibbosus TaxID=931172 RepID=A0AAV6VZA7_9ARAC|nr:hypothetical protein JTE90_027427 [Oedothorax gibbosus]